MPSKRAKRVMVVLGVSSAACGALVWWAVSQLPPPPPDDPDCPDSRVVYPEEDSALPMRLDRCHYERAFAEASVTLQGPTHVTHGPIAIWRELAFGEPSESLSVGVIIAPLPNLFAASMSGARVRLVVESVLAADGRELIDRDGGMMGDFFEELDGDDGFGQPSGSHSVETFAGAFAGDDNFVASRSIDLREAVNEADVAHVRGTVILRLPIDARMVDVPVGGQPVVAGDLRVWAERRDGTAFTLRWTSSDSDFLALDPLPRNDSAFIRSSSFARSDGAATPGSGDVRADFDREVETLRVAFAREFFEHRVPFDIQPEH